MAGDGQDINAPKVSARLQVAPIPPHPVPLGEHPAIVQSLSLARFLEARDLLRAMPTVPTDDEGALLERQFREHEPFPGGWDCADVEACGRNLRRESREAKLVAIRLVWFGWLFGTHWQRIGAPTPLGKAILREWLAGRAAAGDAEAAGLRRRWFPDADEIGAEGAAARHGRLVEQARLLAVQAHRTRMAAARRAWERHALRLGRGEEPDVAAGLETLQRLTRALDAELSWRFEGQRIRMALSAKADWPANP